MFDKCLHSLLDQIMDSIRELLDCLYKELHNYNDYHDKEDNTYLLPNNRTSAFFDDIDSKYENAKIEMHKNKYVPIVVEKNIAGKF